MRRAPSTPLIALLLAGFALTACQCGGPGVVHSYDGRGDAGTGGGTGGGAAGGTGGGVAGGTGGGVAGGTGGGSQSWCASDCDCPAGQRCVSTGGELASNECQTGPSTCTTPCGGACGSGLQCVNGACQTIPCVGSNCTSTFLTPVAGTYHTYYELDIHDFATRAADIVNLLDLLSAALNGNATCAGQTTPQGQLMCIVVSLIAQNIHAPPWVAQLIQVISDTFRFGDRPIRARGLMQLAEQGTTLYAAETWSEMWLEYNGQTYNVINNPTLGANGQIAVTVHAFGGTRSATEVFLGPRDVDFDVNKLIVSLLNVVITAASNNQAHDVGELIELILCDQISPTSSNYLVCRAAATQFAQNFELPVGLGGIHITQQRATIYDLDGNGIADALGLPTAHGPVAGDMSNGLVTGDLGAFPRSWWYGTK